MTTDTTELEDLETLVLSPGWKRVEKMFDQQWGMGGDRFCDAIKRMANDTNKVQAAENVQLVMYVQRELQQFFRGIEARYSELKNRKAPTMSGSRRGTL